MSTDTIELFCLIQENTVAQAFPLKINQNESIGQLKEVIKVKKTSEFNFFTANQIRLWKIQIQGDSDKELTKLMLYKEEQLLPTRKVSSYFSEKPLDEYIHIIIKLPTPHITFDQVYKMGLLKKGDIVEYLEKIFIIKQRYVDVVFIAEIDNLVHLQ
ncbi:2955_t:CDS:1, partial [Funneliformis mosseae]